MTSKTEQWQVVIRYDDPRGGIWYGPAEDRGAADARLLVERSRAQGSVWIERVRS